MSEIFNYRKKTSQSLDICSIMGLPPVAGEVGLEIEVEGNKFKKEEIVKGWKYTHDGSLRGEDNAEYVLKKPILFTEVSSMLDSLWKMMNDHGSVLAVSNRTSVHVHLNCQKFYVDRVASFVGLYMAFEEILTNWCGDHRVGNLFCLRTKDAPAIASEIRQFIRTDGQWQLVEGLHYGGLNLHALSKFGSLEIRTLRGETDVNEIKNWVKMLEKLYKRSGEFTTPDDVCALFSREGPQYFFDSIFGEMADVIRSGCNMSLGEMTDSLYEGIRIAQDVLYCRDWTTLVKTPTTPDPFGRKAKKIVYTAPGDAIAAAVPAGGLGAHLQFQGFVNQAPPPEAWLQDAWAEQEASEQY